MNVGDEVDPQDDFELDSNSNLGRAASVMSIPTQVNAHSGRDVNTTRFQRVTLGSHVLLG